MHCTFHRVQSNALEVLPLQSVKMNFSLKLFNFFLLEVIITSQFHYNVFTSSLNSIYSDYIGPLNYVFKDSKESVASASKTTKLQKQRASGVKFYNLSVLLSHLHELLTEKGKQNPSKQTESGHTCIMELSMISIHYAS